MNLTPEAIWLIVCLITGLAIIAIGVVLYALGSEKTPDDTDQAGC